jgi:hypothetical protein
MLYYMLKLGSDLMFNNVLKWTACAVTLSGALCTAMRIDPTNIILLNVGAALYLLWAVRIREANLIVINAALLAIYVVGLFY